MGRSIEQSAATREVEIPITETVSVSGDLTEAGGASGIVLFAHGSGSSRFSPRNRYVANILQQRGLATLLIDLLTRDEEAIDLRTREKRFDIGLLSGRVVTATKWVLADSRLGRLPIGYFGASTGVAAALEAAADLGEQVKAVVSRGGRPDLAMDRLAEVKAPVLLIVGGDDPIVIEMNRQALKPLQVEKKLSIIPGATHLFEEPGTLEQAAREAAEWFQRFFQ